MSEESSEVPAFACCSAGIGRWYWVAWESESAAREQAPALASGFERTAERAEAKVVERFGPDLRRLPSKWASSFMRGGGGGTGSSDGSEGGRPIRPKARIARPVNRPARKSGGGSARLAFLYTAAEGEPPGPPGLVAVARHRIVKQNPRKIHVDSEPFDEDEWARRSDRSDEGSDDPPKTRTLAVDRLALRAEGRFSCRHAGRELVFYPSEEDGLRDVEAALTAKHDWCATLGVRFPCSVDAIKAAYRRLAMASHPDAGGDPAQFRAVEQAYREALAYLDRGDPG